MRCKKKKLCVFLLVCAVATNVWAADVMWFGGGTTVVTPGVPPGRDWFNAENWNADPPPPGPVPGWTDKAKVDFVWNNPGPIIGAPGAIANEVFIAEGGPSLPGYQELIVQSGADLTSNGQILLGYYNVDDGGLVCDGGTINANQHLFVGFMGDGTVTVNSGTINIGNMFGIAWAGGNGHVQLNGGILHTEQWNFTNSGGTASMDVAGGEWIQEHFWLPQIKALVNAGTIYTSLPGHTVEVTWDPVLEQTHVKAVCTACIEVAIDIKPTSCPNPLNVNNKGVLSVAIVGSEELDVTTIDVASIRLEGVAPVNNELEDVTTPAVGGECACTEDGPDGFTDLTVRFPTQEVVDALCEFSSGETLVLTLTGELSDGTNIEGTDCIRIKKLRAKRPKKGR